MEIVKQVQKALARRQAELKATQRPIAKALGVGRNTINRDLRAPNGTPEQANPVPALYENGPEPGPTIPNGTPNNSQDVQTIEAPVICWGLILAAPDFCQPTGHGTGANRNPVTVQRTSYRLGPLSFRSQLQD